MTAEPDNWAPVAAASSLRDNVPAAVFPKGLPVLLIRKGPAEVYALANKCAHMGCPLQRGPLDGYILQCPCHDWRFDIRTGVFLDAAEISVRVYRVKTEEGKIFVDLREG